MQPQSEGTVSEAGTSTSAVATAAALGHDLTFSPQLVITPTISPEAISVARHEAAAPPPQPVALAASSNFKHLPAVVHDNTDEPKPVLTITPAHLPSQPPAAAPTTPRRSLATRTSMPHYLHQLQQQQQRPPEQPPTCVTGSHVHLRPSGVVAGGGGAGMGDPWDQYFSPPASPMVLPRRRTGPYLRPVSVALCGAVWRCVWCLGMTVAGNALQRRFVWAHTHAATHYPQTLRLSVLQTPVFLCPPDLLDSRCAPAASLTSV